jgi:glycosyltransferase involved in cell wall biosynthesis
MKILVLSDLFPPFPGGAERFVFNIARELQKRGHEIHVMTSYHKFGEGWMGDYQPATPRVIARDGMIIHFYPIGIKAQGLPAHDEGWRVIKNVMGGGQTEGVCADLILTHHFFAYEFEQELKDCGVPVVQIVHNTRRLPFAKLAIFNSDFTRSRVGSCPGDMTIAPPALEDVIANTHGDSIGFVKPIAHKGVDFFYHLAAMLPDRRFLVLRGEWKTLEDIRVRSNVEFMDPQLDIRRFYERCRILLMPSCSEDAGTIPQEAAANGLPCISTHVGGLNETNEGGIRLPMDRALWIEQIVKLDDPKYYAEIAARQYLKLASFEWAKRFDELSMKIKDLAVA